MGCHGCISRFLFLGLVTILSTLRVLAQGKLLDDFENLKGWEVYTSSDVHAKISSAPGKKGKALMLECEFQSPGYAIAHKRFAIDLPANYKFTFYLRGEIPVNHFEFKLIDSLENVFWLKKLNVEYPRDWQKITIQKNQIVYAWGPSGGGTIRRVSAIEFVVSAGTGGKGKIFIDDFRLEPVADPSTLPPPVARAASEHKKHRAAFAIDGNSETLWKSSTASEEQWLLIDFHKARDFGGLVIEWDKEDYATRYDVEVSNDGDSWKAVYAVEKGNGGRDYIFVRDGQARLMRLNLKASSQHKGYGVRSIEIKDVDFSFSPNMFFQSIAQGSPAGYYPQWLTGKQSFWTIVGASGDTKEALINEQGAIEVDKGSFSLEPFLYVDDKLVTWHDVDIEPSLHKGYLPMPSVVWMTDDLRLHITAFAFGTRGRSNLMASYLIENTGKDRSTGKLFIAIRPFQLVPPWQHMVDMEPGVSPIKSISYDGQLITVNSNKTVVSLAEPDGFGAAVFDQGDITEYLSSGTLPTEGHVTDHFGYASAAVSYLFNLASGESRRIAVVVPFHQMAADLKPNRSAEEVDRFVREKFVETETFWETEVANIDIKLPGSAQKIVDVLKSNLAYILINRDGPAIQPGSRTYERSWIRDGSLTSTALLRTGNFDEVREYLDWFATYQYPDGKIPCAVDHRGPDPVPEHDSHGEFIYAVMEYFRFTGDTTWLRGKFENVKKAIGYMESLRNQRKTAEYTTGGADKRAFYGLLMPSISHEGYATPVHSYWDNFFGVRGYKDATSIAGILGEKELEKHWAVARDDFRAALNASLKLAMVNKNIDFIPGCAEKGDFDATSTTIGLDPAGELDNIPQPQLNNTFQKYYQFFQERQKDAIPWSNYTPYENRIIGSFIYLGQKERAHELLRFFLKDLHPLPWNHWAEVVWREPSTGKYIGDMPHTWCGSDFMRSVFTFFAFERESDGAVVLGAGIPEEWLHEGVEVRRLATHYGWLSYVMKQEGDSVNVRLSEGLRIPPGGIIVKSPRSMPLMAVSINGKPSNVFTGDEIRIHALPAEIVMKY